MKDLSEIPTWQLEGIRNPRPFGRMASSLPMRHHAPQGAHMAFHDAWDSVEQLDKHLEMPSLDETFISRAGLPTTREQFGLARSDGVRPDAVTLIPWQGGVCLAWDAAVIVTLAESHRSRSEESAGAAVAEIAVDRKSAKCTSILPAYCCLMPFAFETLGPINYEGMAFVISFGHRLTQISCDSREVAFLYQRLSVAIQRFNTVAFRGAVGLHGRLPHGQFQKCG